MYEYKLALNNYNIFNLFTGGIDFILNVTFDAGVTMINVTVPIIPDIIVEEDEMFYLRLVGFDDQPNTISEPDGAWATIIDDDSKLAYVFSFDIRTYVSI